VNGDENMSDKITASEALYGFGAWLTTLREPITVSQRHDAGIVAELVSEYCKANNLQEPRDDWYKNTVSPATRDTYTDPITAEPIEHVNKL
jgi:hypothetical protein